MDLEEVYLRQIDQKLKRQNELQEENNELLKELLKALSKQGDNNMHKILATAFIMALTTCYPVHAATKYIVGAEMKFEKKRRNAEFLQVVKAIYKNAMGLVLDMFHILLLST